MNTHEIDYGGPAFPRPIGVREGVHNNSQVGMSLRDWFAGQATEKDIDAHQQYIRDSIGDAVPKYTREQAKYRYADAMIAARKTTHPPTT